MNRLMTLLLPAVPAFISLAILLRLVLRRAFWRREGVPVQAEVESVELRGRYSISVLRFQEQEGGAYHRIRFHNPRRPHRPGQMLPLRYRRGKPSETDLYERSFRALLAGLALAGLLAALLLAGALA